MARDEKEEFSGFLFLDPFRLLFTVDRDRSPTPLQLLTTPDTVSQVAYGADSLPVRPYARVPTVSKTKKSSSNRKFKITFGKVIKSHPLTKFRKV